MKKQVISADQVMNLVPYFIPAAMIFLIQVLLIDREMLDLSIVIGILFTVPVAVLIMRMMKNIAANYKANLAQKSLQIKTEKLAQELKKVADPASRIEDIVPFFEKTTAFIDGLTHDEWSVCSNDLKRFLGRVGRGAWNRTPKGETTKIHHIWIQPTGHYDEDWRCRSLQDLIQNPGVPTSQGGAAKRPMDDKEFYFLAFVKPFMQNKYQFLLRIQKEIQQ